MTLAAPRCAWHWPWQVLALCALGCFLGAAPASAEEGRTVLVIYSNNRLLLGNIALDRGAQ